MLISIFRIRSISLALKTLIKEVLIKDNTYFFFYFIADGLAKQFNFSLINPLIQFKILLIVVVFTGTIFTYKADNAASRYSKADIA